MNKGRFYKILDKYKPTRSHTEHNSQHNKIIDSKELNTILDKYRTKTDPHCQSRKHAKFNNQQMFHNYVHDSPQNTLNNLTRL